MDEALSHNQPIFILGNPRSGTTMLRLMLTSHQEIGIPPESEFIVRLFTRFGHLKRFSKANVTDLRAQLSGDPIDLAEQWEVPLDALLPDEGALVGQSYPMVCASIYNAYQDAKGLPPALYWGDKNNAYGQYVDLLANLYPQARFIHLIRDGRAVLNSYRKLSTNDKSRYAPTLPKDARDVAMRWADTTSRIQRHLHRYAANRSISLRYEDLLENAEMEARRLCNFLEVPYDGGMLEFHLQNKELALEPTKYAWKANTFRPLDKKKGDRWREELPVEAIEKFEAHAGRALIRYGYEAIPADKGKRVQSLKFFASSRLRESLRHVRVNLVRLRGMLEG